MTARFDAVLFDIDNVLVDTRASYLAAIQKTVERSLACPGAVSARDVDRFKLLGGFNDDWDCCFGLITFLETAIQGKPVRFGDPRRRRLTIAELPEIFPERPLGLEGLMKHLRILYEHVEIPSYKKIARTFQEIYWGKGRRPSGLIRKEKLVFPRPLLDRIRSEGVRLGIVTGRDRTEAEYALRRFGIYRLFDAMVTIDDVKKEERKSKRLLRKPNPWPLLEAARRIRRGTPGKRGQVTGTKLTGNLSPSSPLEAARRLDSRLRFLYVGDLPDDILAARRAKKFIQIQSAAFPKYSRDPETTLLELKKVRPDYLLRKPSELLQLL